MVKRVRNSSKIKSAQKSRLYIFKYRLLTFFVPECVPCNCIAENLLSHKLHYLLLRLFSNSNATIFIVVVVTFVLLITFSCPIFIRAYSRAVCKKAEVYDFDGYGQSSDNYAM